MDKFLIRAPKRARAETAAQGLVEVSEVTGSRAATSLDLRGSLPPTRIVSWNCNSLKLRAEQKHLGAAISSFLAEGADALVLQEIRLKPEDRASCETALKSAGLRDHLFYWSLHPGNKRYSGTAFIVSKACQPISVRYTLSDLVDPKLTYRQKGTPKWEDPDQEGRVVVLEYSACWIVGVYTPNCTWFQAGRLRRADWDARFGSAIQVLQHGRAAAATTGAGTSQLAAAGRNAFMQASSRQHSLTSGVTGRPVIIIGDLNVCHTPLDVSHPEWFAKAMKPANVGVQDPGMQGQPGYTQEERDRFGKLLLHDCDLLDTFRVLHPDQQRHTWGFASSTQAGRQYYGKYYGKYMGLDYALVSRTLWPVVVSSRILGCLSINKQHGANPCHGSDHVPIMLHCDWSKATSPASGAPPVQQLSSDMPPQQQQQDRSQTEQHLRAAAMVAPVVASTDSAAFAEQLGTPGTV